MALKIKYKYTTLSKEFDFNCISWDLKELTKQTDALDRHEELKNELEACIREGRHSDIFAKVPFAKGDIFDLVLSYGFFKLSIVSEKNQYFNLLKRNSDKSDYKYLRFTHEHGNNQLHLDFPVGVDDRADRVKMLRELSREMKAMANSGWAQRDIFAVIKTDEMGLAKILKRYEFVHIKKVLIVLIGGRLFDMFFRCKYGASTTIKND